MLHWDSLVAIVTCYQLDSPGIESWNRWDFLHLSKPALDVQPASCTMGTWAFSQEWSSWAFSLTTHPYLVPSLKKIRCVPFVLQAFMVCSRVNFVCFFYFILHIQLKRTAFWNMALFLSWDESMGRHLLRWVWQEELFSISGKPVPIHLYISKEVS